MLNLIDYIFSLIAFKPNEGKNANFKCTKMKFPASRKNKSKHEKKFVQSISYKYTCVDFFKIYMGQGIFVILSSMWNTVTDIDINCVATICIYRVIWDYSSLMYVIVVNLVLSRRLLIVTNWMLSYFRLPIT